MSSDPFHNKLLKATDIVLSARVVHAEVERVKTEAHRVCDPHIALASVSSQRTAYDPVQVASELAMVDAATVLSKECMDEVEKLQRAIAKDVAQFEVLKALGVSAFPSEDIDEIDSSIDQCAMRIDEMSKVLELADKRCKTLVAQF